PVYAIIPFEDLVPQWKVLEVDGLSPIRKDFDRTVYPLSVPIALHGVDTGPEGTVLMAFESLLSDTFNRDRDKLTTIVLTGVTALVRATAWEMELKGITYPAIDVGEMLREADLTHISNEVPFVEKCPEPDPGQTGMVFCSDPKYMELLKEVGTDVVELTGDHFGDWGSDAVLYSLGLYKENGLPYYGGGATPEEGRRAVTFEHNGNKIAFLGCNGKGGGYAPGAIGLPGAIDCDFDIFANEIESVIEEGYLVIFTFQHNEVYSFVPGQQLMNDFRTVARYGAKIVSGSQAHQPHNIEFYEDSILMYGLGNLFFDQVGVSEDTARALIARHVIYDNKHISTELFTIYFSDYSRPRYMDEEGRIKLLTDVFTASGW
ncbi:MAG: CapA family protein, partial [Anaerolineales bacterium]